MFCKWGLRLNLRPHVVHSMRYGLQYDARRCNRFFGHLRSAGDLRDLEQNLLPERARRRVLQKLTSVLGCAKTDYPPTRGGRAGGRTQRDCVPSSTWPVPSRGSRVPAACHVDVALRNVIYSLVRDATAGVGPACALAGTERCGKRFSERATRLPTRSCAQRLRDVLHACEP
jgi:hypothetical protein